MTEQDLQDTQSENAVAKKEDDSKEVAIQNDRNNEIRTKADDAYEYSQLKMKELIDAGEDAIFSFKEICEETGEPRAYEVLATLLKNTGDMTQAVMKNAKERSSIEKDLKNESEEKKQANYTQNNNRTVIFSGSTKELLDKVKEELDADVIENES